MDYTGQRKNMIVQHDAEKLCTASAKRRKVRLLLLPVLIGSAIGTVVLSSFAISGVVRKSIFRETQNAAYAQIVSDVQNTESTVASSPVSSRRSGNNDVYLRAILQILPRLGVM